MLAIYARQSIDRENSVSIETQIEFSKGMLRQSDEKSAVKIYADRGYGGGNTNRPAFIEMIEDIKNNRIEKVVTYKLDRISRSLSDFVNILRIFKEHNIEFVSSQEGFDTSGVYGDLIFKLLMVFAEFERTSIINRITDAYAVRSEMGFYMGGRLPYGFVTVPFVIGGKQTKKYAPFPEEAEQIKYIFKMYAEENVSLRSLLSGLVSKNIKPLSGSPWTTAKLGAILKNPIYVKADADIYTYYQDRGVKIINNVNDFTGIYGAQLYGKTKHDPRLPDYSDMKLILLSHEGLVPSETWLRCRLKLEQNKQFGSAANSRGSWLSGKIKCGKCGHTMTAVKGKPDKDGNTERYFLCGGKLNKKNCTGTMCTVYAEDLENAIENYISRKISYLSKNNLPYTNTANEKLNPLKIKLKEIEAEENTLMDRLLCGNKDAAVFELAEARAKELKIKKELLREKIRTFQRDLKSQGTSLFEMWSAVKFDKKKIAAKILIDKILLYEDGTCEILWNI